MPETEVLVKTSSFGTLNGTDWWRLFLTLLIQIGSAIVTALLSWLVYLQNDSSVPSWLIPVIPIVQVVLTQIGKTLQKLLDGPSATAVEQANAGITPKGFEVVEGIKKVE